MGGKNVMSKQASLRWLCIGAMCGLLLLFTLLGPVHAASADEVSPSPEPAVTATPTDGPEPEPEPEHVLPSFPSIPSGVWPSDPVAPPPETEGPPAGEQVPPQALPSASSPGPVTQQPDPALADVAPAVPGGIPALVVPQPEVAATPEPAIEPSASATETNPGTSVSESASAVVAPSPSTPVPASSQLRNASPVEQVVSAAAGSPLAVQALTVAVLVGVGVLYFRILGSRGMRTPSRSVE